MRIINIGFELFIIPKIKTWLVERNYNLIGKIVITPVDITSRLNGNYLYTGIKLNFCINYEGEEIKVFCIFAPPKWNVQNFYVYNINVGTNRGFFAKRTDVEKKFDNGLSDEFKRELSILFNKVIDEYFDEYLKTLSENDKNKMLKLYLKTGSYDWFTEYKEY